MCLSVFLPTIVAVVWSSLASVNSLSAATPECSGHGHYQGNISEGCVCDVPYTGSKCQQCADGFYRIKEHDSTCYIPCSGNNRFLHNFTSAGVGVPPSWIAARPSLEVLPYCLWVIAPLVERTNSSSREYESPFLPSNANSSNMLNPSLRMSLEFITDQTSQCYDETVLIYSGLPEFLNSSLTHYELNKTGVLLGMFTGSQLMNHSVTVSSPVVTVVYYASTMPASRLRGFNLMVRTDLQLEQADGWPLNGSSKQDAVTCEPSPADSTSNSTIQDLVYLSTLPPFLSSHLPVSSGEIKEVNSTTMLFSPDQGCPGRRHHTALYDHCSDSIWVYGGLDRSDKICEGVTVIILPQALSGVTDTSEEEGRVRWIRNGGDAPSDRFFHAAALVPCQQSSNGSQLLVFGGFTSRLVTSRELWLYSGQDEQWRQLQSAPDGFAVAGHTATLTADGRLVVVGGVNSDLHISSKTLIYHLGNGSWEVMPTRTLDPPGVYGHSAVYDVISNSVLVYGGYMYARPQAVVSSSLYSFNLTTLIWRRVKLAIEVPARMFHSMVVISNLLVIHGGLLSQQGGQPGLEGMCPSNDITLIDLVAACNGRQTITLSAGSGSSCGGGYWGHRLVGGEDNIFVIGGEDVFTGAILSELHFPPVLTCSLAQAAAQCQEMPGCLVCTHNHTNEFITCLNISNSNATLLCSAVNGVLLMSEEDSDFSSSSMCQPLSLSCEQFDTCGSCLSTDLAVEMGCVWCSCQKRCMSSKPSPEVSVSANCSCVTSNSTQPEICFFDICTIPSCSSCQAEDGCQWLSRQIRDDPNNNIIHVLTSVQEGGCYSNTIHRAVSQRVGFDVSVGSCSQSCSRATSCSSCVTSVSPTARPETSCVWAEYSGECMSVDLVSLACSRGECGPILARCPTPCASRNTCEFCLMHPSCVWLNHLGSSIPRCIEVRDLKSGTLNMTEDEMVVYYECPGGVSCYEYCHGNSETCVRRMDFDGNVNSEFVEWVRLGPDEEEEVVCLECGGFSHGSRCESCLTGYFNSNPGGLTRCKPCACNDHDLDECDPANGFCSCQNNTRSVPCEGDICFTFSQCSLCEPTYAGDPRNNGQCYKQILLSSVANFSLPANQSTSFFFGPGADGYFYVNVDIRATFVVTRGLLDVYVSTDPSDVMVTLNRDTWAHHLTFQPGVKFIFQSNSLTHLRSTKSLDDWLESDGERLDRQRRTMDHSFIDASQDFGLYHFVVDERLSLIVSHGQQDFSSSNFFVTVFARDDAHFFFYYRQDLPRLNIFVFFSLFLCFFVLLSSLVVYVYQLGMIIVRQRRRRRRKLRQERRANRPLVKVVVYFPEKKQSASTKKKQEVHKLLQTLDVKSIDTGVFKRPSSDVKDEDKKEKPQMKSFDAGVRRSTIEFEQAISRVGESDEACELGCVTCSEAAGVIELAACKGQTLVTDSVGHKKRKKYLVLSADDICTWPVCIEPTTDEVACLSTILVQLPSSSSRDKEGGGRLCMATAILDYPKAMLTLADQEQEKGRKRLRFRRRNRLAPTPGTNSTTTTHL